VFIILPTYLPSPFGTSSHVLNQLPVKADPVVSLEPCIVKKLACGLTLLKPSTICFGMVLDHVINLWKDDKSYLLETSINPKYKVGGKAVVVILCFSTTMAICSGIGVSVIITVKPTI